MFYGIWRLDFACFICFRGVLGVGWEGGGGHPPAFLFNSLTYQFYIIVADAAASSCWGRPSWCGGGAFSCLSVPQFNLPFLYHCNRLSRRSSQQLLRQYKLLRLYDPPGPSSGCCTRTRIPLRTFSPGKNITAAAGAGQAAAPLQSTRTKQRLLHTDQDPSQDILTR